MDTKKPCEEASGTGLTRREWLLSLGSAVVLSGYSGAPMEATQETQSGPAADLLPPGLYLPSPDHLAHALTIDDPFHPIPPGSETEYVRPRLGPFVPQAFTPDEFPVIRRLVEIILGEDLRDANEPRVPGAPESIYDEVAEWIDLVVASAPAVRAAALSLPADQRALAAAFLGSDGPWHELANFEPERICREGLAWLSGESHRRHGKEFLEITSAGQIELVNSVSDARAEASNSHAGTSLFNFLKAESIRGFYTSRRGLKELDYKGNAFYAESPGCPAADSPQGEETPRSANQISGR